MLITVLSTLTVVQAYFNSVTSTMGQISVVVNKLKLPVFVSLGCGIISIIAEIVLIKFFGMGLYAIVLSTTVVMIARYIVFNSFYAAWCLKQPMTYFLPAALKTWLSIVEGPTDEDALSSVLKQIFSSAEVHFHVIYGDITTEDAITANNAKSYQRSACRTRL